MNRLDFWMYAQKTDFILSDTLNLCIQSFYKIEINMLENFFPCHTEADLGVYQNTSIVITLLLMYFDAPLNPPLSYVW